MTEQYIAHIRQSDNAHQSLRDHLTETAQLAEAYARKLGLPSVGFLLGLLHDLGKYHPDFQRYIRQFDEPSAGKYAEQDMDVETEYEPAPYVKSAEQSGGVIRRGQVDHSTAGAKYLDKVFRKFSENYPSGSFEGLVYRALASLSSLCIASHHSGLINVCNEDKRSTSDLLGRCKKEVSLGTVISLAGEDDLLGQVQNESYKQAFTELKYKLLQIGTCTARQDTKLKETLLVEFQLGFLTRLLFSCLIDADRTNSIQFEFPERSSELADTQVDWSIPVNRLEAKYDEFAASQKADSQEEASSIGSIRSKIAKACLARANDPQNVFSLTIPTGGGKTLASLRFALNHAAHHQLDRIIYIIPFTSIIEQNAQAVRDILELSEGERGQWVLEQHSNLDRDVDTWQSKLVSERWNTPIVFTTMVQFLESCFSGGTKGVRRMHQLSRSVLIFDEIQTLPINCYNLFNNAVNFLTYHCGSSAVLCTATQPKLHDLPDKAKAGGELRQPKEIYGDSAKDLELLFDTLRRVHIHTDSARERFDEDAMAEFILDKYRTHDNTLVIVNTKRWASKLYEKLLANVDDEYIYHLSTSQCAQHRKNLIRKIKEKLAQGEPLLVISTQLIEAGVDISFNSVVRFMAGLDSVLQAAGRCNRHGELADRGHVYLVMPKGENLDMLPTIKHGQETLHTILFEQEPDTLNEMKLDLMVDRYFGKFYASEGLADQMCFPINQRGEKPVSLYSDSIYELLSNPLADNSPQGALTVNIYQAFRTAGEAFAVINAPTHPIIVPYGKEGIRLIEDVCEGIDGEEPLHVRLRRAQQFTVNVFPHEFNKLAQAGAIHQPEGMEKYGIFILLPQFYSDGMGVTHSAGRDDELMVF